MTRPAVALIVALLISFIVSMYTANATGFYGIAVAVAASTFVFAAVCMIVTLRSIGMTPAEYLKGLGKFPVRLITAELRRGRDLLGIGKIGR